MGKVGKELRRARDKVTGKSKAEEEARNAEQRAKEEAEKRAREQAELEAAQSAASTAGQGAEQAETDIGSEGTKQSAQKKKLKGGKKGLSISRASGSGINI